MKYALNADAQFQEESDHAAGGAPSSVATKGTSATSAQRRKTLIGAHTSASVQV